MEDRYVFVTEWFDPTAALLRRYQLFFYPKDGSVEMFDVKNQRIFLRRTKYQEVRQDDLFIGSRVNIFSRQLNLIDYGDQFTANHLGSKKERTLALVKTDVLTRIGDVLDLIFSSKLMVTKARMTRLTASQAADFYVEHQSKPFFSDLVQFASSGAVVAMELMGDEAVSVWRGLLGPADSAVAQREAPLSLRARRGTAGTGGTDGTAGTAGTAGTDGTDGVGNVGHGSDSLAAAARELEFFFPSTAGQSPAHTATLTCCTCCIIKPHAVSEGVAGKILNAISDAGFHISALQMFSVERLDAEEFFEVYKGVVPEYPHMVTELSSGPCLVLEITGDDGTQTFRDFCGPADPECARRLRPNTLRALYGKDKVRNAVHCTDLPEDALLEVQYFFQILDG